MEYKVNDIVSINDDLFDRAFADHFSSNIWEIQHITDGNYICVNNGFFSIRRKYEFPPEVIKGIVENKRV